MVDDSFEDVTVGSDAPRGFTPSAPRAGRGASPEGRGGGESFEERATTALDPTQIELRGPTATRGPSPEGALVTAPPKPQVLKRPFIVEGKVQRLEVVETPTGVVFGKSVRGFAGQDIRGDLVFRDPSMPRPLPEFMDPPSETMVLGFEPVPTFRPTFPRPSPESPEAVSETIVFGVAPPATRGVVVPKPPPRSVIQPKRIFIPEDVRRTGFFTLKGIAKPRPSPRQRISEELTVLDPITGQPIGTTTRRLQQQRVVFDLLGRPISTRVPQADIVAARRRQFQRDIDLFKPSILLRVRKEPKIDLERARFEREFLPLIPGEKFGVEERIFGSIGRGFSFIRQAGIEVKGLGIKKDKPLVSFAGGFTKGVGGRGLGLTRLFFATEQIGKRALKPPSVEEARKIRIRSREILLGTTLIGGRLLTSARGFPKAFLAAPFATTGEIAGTVTFGLGVSKLVSLRGAGKPVRVFKPRLLRTRIEPRRLEPLTATRLAKIRTGKPPTADIFKVRFKIEGVKGGKPFTVRPLSELGRSFVPKGAAQVLKPPRLEIKSVTELVKVRPRVFRPLTRIFPVKITPRLVTQTVIKPTVKLKIPMVARGAGRALTVTELSRVTGTFAVFDPLRSRRVRITEEEQAVSPFFVSPLVTPITTVTLTRAQIQRQRSLQSQILGLGVISAQRLSQVSLQRQISLQRQTQLQRQLQRQVQLQRIGQITDLGITPSTTPILRTGLLTAQIQLPVTTTVTRTKVTPTTLIPTLLVPELIIPGAGMPPTRRRPPPKEPKIIEPGPSFFDLRFPKARRRRKRKPISDRRAIFPLVFRPSAIGLQFGVPRRRRAFFTGLEIRGL